MATTAYKKSALTGGAATALDSIDGNSLLDGDFAFVLTGTIQYTYVLNATSGAAESSPDIISPDSNAGNKRWILQATNSGAGITKTDHIAESTAGHGTLYDTAIADNLADTTIATTAYAKSQDAVLHHGPDQGVALTAAASGSSGITAADNDNIDFGTGNFTLVWKGSLPNWTLASQGLVQKYSGAQIGWTLYNATDNKIYALLDYRGLGGSYKELIGTVVMGCINNAAAEIVLSITKQTASVAGNAALYVNGVFIENIAIGAATVYSVSNAESLYVMGTDAVRTAGTVHHAILYNRALTAAEELDRYRNGVALKHFDPTGVSPASQTAQTSGTLVVGKEYTIDNWITNDDFTNVGGTNVDGTIFVATGTTPTTWTNSSSLRRTGATFMMLPEGLHEDRPRDSSGNNLTVAYPATGWNLTRPPAKKTMQPTPTDGSTGAVTVTIAMILNGIITGNPSAARAYTLETGATSDAWPSLAIDSEHEWSIINTNATYAITLTAASGHTIAGTATVSPSESAKFKTRKTAASTFVTYREAGGNDEAVAMSSKAPKASPVFTGDVTLSGNVKNGTLPLFFAYNSAVDDNVTGDGTAFTVIFDSELADQSSSFATNTFTAPATGKYVLLVNLALIGIAANHTSLLVKIITSNRIYTQYDGLSIARTEHSLTMRVVADMDMGDTAYVTLTGTGGSKEIDVDGYNSSEPITFFSGYMVC